MKKVKAVKPFIYKNNSNFKLAVYREWEKAGGAVVAWHPLRNLYKTLSYHLDLPTFHQSSNTAHLCFVEGASFRFDAFPDYTYTEVVPMVWDCWPDWFPKLEAWMKKHRVRSAIFTSSQTAERMKKSIPDMNILSVTEGIETELYQPGAELGNRDIDYLEFGRCSKIVDSQKLDPNIKVLSSRNESGALQTRLQLIRALANSKITITLTRQDTQPEKAKGIDTLTQRYWECMLSRVIMMGRAPKELTELIGYNPTIPIDLRNFNKQVAEILAHPDDYQPLVDRNRNTALRMGDWNIRIRHVMDWLEERGYRVK